MVVSVAQHVLRRDREKTADGEWPERGALWLGEKGETDAADVGAQEIHDLAAIEPRQQRLGAGANQERGREPVVSADHVVAELRYHEDERDQERDEIARVDLACAV